MYYNISMILILSSSLSITLYSHRIQTKILHPDTFNWFHSSFGNIRILSRGQINRSVFHANILREVITRGIF